MYANLTIVKQFRTYWYLATTTYECFVRYLQSIVGFISQFFCGCHLHFHTHSISKRTQTIEDQQAARDQHAVKMRMQRTMNVSIVIL